MRFIETDLPGVVVIEPDVHRDDRGFFLETYHVERYREAGIAAPFLQINHSRSVGGTVRGLHAQRRRPQGKLIRVLAGEFFDVAVDIRRGSPTFGRWVAAELSESNRLMLWVPRGFAHGFAALTDVADVFYKMDAYYSPAHDRGVRWNDGAIGVAWPDAHPLLSPKDAAAPLLADAENDFVYEGT
jgi:dTDP-4-dehydrorhamnose 3,5-epimerase